VADPRPIQEYLSIVGKFSHFKEADTAHFQNLVNDRYNLVKSLCETTQKNPPTA
jgi:hypothetical protein